MTTSYQNSPAAYLEDRPVLTRGQARFLGVMAPLIIALGGTWLATGDWTEQFEAVTLDWRFRVRGPRQPPLGIIIVEIDEESRRALKRDGRQFDLREHLPSVIDHLADAGALVIGLDIWFEEQSSSETDQLLAQAISGANVVLAVTHTDGRLKRAPDLFLASRPQEGVITVYPDPGNVLRRFPRRLYLNVLREDGPSLDVRFIPHFPLALAQYAALQHDEDARVDFDEEGAARIGPYVVHPGELIDFAATERGDGADGPRWRTLRFRDAAGGNFSGSDVDGAIVIIGESRSIQDSFVMPLSKAAAPGSYYHANALAHILEQRRFNDGWSRKWRRFALSFALAFAAGLFAWNQRPWWRYRRGLGLLPAYLLAGTAVFLGGWTWLTFYSFNRSQLLPLFAPLGAMSLALASGLAAQWIITSANTRRLDRRNRQIESLFGQSVSNSILEALKRNPEQIRRTETREVSVLFCDLRNFTAQSSEMAPAEVATMLNEYFNYVTAAVFEHDGFIDKFVGDEIMAVFSVPFAQPDHAERAVRTAVAMKRRLAELNRVRTARGQRPLDCGLGVHCGPAAAGHIGSRERSNYTVVGTTVNLAARIEQLTKHGEILVSDIVRRQLPSDINVRFWNRMELRGAHGRFDLYEIELDPEKPSAEDRAAA